KPGERLMEIQLAEELGVSRTPVREAIRKLELEGFVVMVPRKGAYVADISLKDIAEVFEIRTALEGLAAELAAERATEEQLEGMERLLVAIAECIERQDEEGRIEKGTEVHDLLFAASHNQRLVPTLRLPREEIQLLRARTQAKGERMKDAWEEHRAIVEALGRRDSNRARALAQAHSERAQSSLMKLITDEPA